MLGALRIEEAGLIAQYANNEKIALMTLHIPHPYTEGDAIAWINLSEEGFRNGHLYTFRVGLRPAGEFIGGISLTITQPHQRAELGYWIAEPFWRLGYATEAVGAVLAYGFKELRLHKIYATHLVENPASGRVMLKNGMIKEGALVDHVFKEGRFFSLIQYRLTLEEYHRQRKS